MMATRIGRPRGLKIHGPCGAGASCLRGADGKPAVVEKPPSSVWPGRKMYCDDACRTVGRAAPTRTSKVVRPGYCEAEGHPSGTPREYEATGSRVSTRICKNCRYKGMTNQVASPCQWCGEDVMAKPSANRRYHTTEAPEPPCGWPEGVRLTCWDFGQYKNFDLPMRFVNGKPVRLWKDRNGVERPQIWDPNKGRVGGWKFEHRWVVELQTGEELPSNVYIHHDDEDKKNNDIANLIKKSQAQHIADHHAENKARVDRFRKMLSDAGYTPEEIEAAEFPARAQKLFPKKEG